MSEIISVGLDNFVLLDNYHDKSEFVENLKKRYESDIIYVRIY